MFSNRAHLIGCHLAQNAPHALGTQLGFLTWQPCTQAVAAGSTLLRGVWVGHFILGGQARSIVTGYSHIPKSQHDPYRTPPKNYVQLLQHITRARQLATLDRLVSEYGPKFDGVHVAAAMSMLPKLHKPPQAGARLSTKKLKQRREVPEKLLAKLQELAAVQVPRLFPREVASITWALGRCRRLLPGDSGHNPATRALVTSMLQRLGRDNCRMLYQGGSGAEVAKLLHGIARLKLGKAQHAAVQQLCWFVKEQPQKMHIKELAAAAWALAKIGHSSAAASAALDAISRQAVALKLYLRPVSMCSLATACAHLKRRDEALLAAVAEEALLQVKDFRPIHLAVLSWAYGRLGVNPGLELLAGIVAASRAQLESFGAVELGLLLQGLRQLQGLDKQLLAEVAAGIAREDEVALRHRDAVRILAAFVAAPDAGTIKDVDGMAVRIGGALRRQTSSAAPHQVTNLVVCYSKLPCQHPFVLRLLQEAVHRPEEFSMDMWVRLLQSCERLGYSDPAARDPRLVAFYAAADKHLQRHLLGAAAPKAEGTAAGAAAQKQDSPQQQKWWQRKPKQQQQKWWQLGQGVQAQEQPDAEAEQPSEKQQQQQQKQPHGLQFSSAVDAARLLGARGALSETSAGYLADVGAKLLPDMTPRRLMLLLTAVMSSDRMAGIDDVRQLLVAAAGKLAQADLSQLSLTVLVGLTQPLGRVLSRNMLVAQGEQLLKGIYAQLDLQQCSQQQLLLVWDSMRRAGVQDEALQDTIEAVAASRGWPLPQEQGWQWGPLGV